MSSPCPMRRKDRQTSDTDVLTLLETAEYGVLSTVDAEAQPYGVPLSFILLDGLIYFHCAMEGRKITNIMQNPAVCFTVVGRTFPVYQNNFTTYYESAMVFGSIKEVADPADKTRALHAIAAKYLPRHLDKAEDDIRKSLDRTAVYGITPSAITGKAKR